MRLSKLMEESNNLRQALDQLEVLGKPKNPNFIHVHAYVVHAFYRKAPKLNRKKRKGTVLKMVMSR